MSLSTNLSLNSSFHINIVYVKKTILFLPSQDGETNKDNKTEEDKKEDVSFFLVIKDLFLLFMQ